MSDGDHKWKEKEWEHYANELVSTDHSLRNGSYQRIPDRNGDCGLEGVSDYGCGYQSYADQRIEKQKKKIYEDPEPNQVVNPAAAVEPRARESWRGGRPGAEPTPFAGAR
jgi:hypothetical protein